MWVRMMAPLPISSSTDDAVAPRVLMPSDQPAEIRSCDWTQPSSRTTSAARRSGADVSRWVASRRVSTRRNAGVLGSLIVTSVDGGDAVRQWCPARRAGHTDRMSSPTPAQDSGITVDGYGVASTPVDQVVITLGVEIMRPDAGEAFRTAGATVTRMLSILSDNGVDARSVRTAELSLGARTDYRDGAEVLLGYQASQRLIVQLDALGVVETILSEVVARGGVGVRIDSVTLSSADPVAAQRTARNAAFGDAAAKAQQYAELAGRELGPVVRIDETADRGGPVPLSFARSRIAAVAGSMPVATGDTEIGVSVTVRWAFADVDPNPLRPV